MLYTLSVPCKTFLAGEYVALQGKPVLMLMTEPRFELQVSKTMEPSSPATNGLLAKVPNPFHPQSPAGQFYELNKEALSGYEFKFIDPLVGRGGFGSSSAEFLLLKSFLQLVGSLTSGSELDLDLKELLSSYWELPGHQAVKPSGADVVGQRVGGMIYFTREEGLFKRLSWTFADLDFRLVHTGVKLKTHEHLRDLKKLDFSVLAEKTEALHHAIIQADEGQFILNINELGQELGRLGLLAEHSFALMQSLRTELPILAAKGCGAMGSDVVLIVFRRDETQIVERWLTQHNYFYLGGIAALAKGLEIKEQHEVI